MRARSRVGCSNSADSTGSSLLLWLQCLLGHGVSWWPVGTRGHEVSVQSLGQLRTSEDGQESAEAAMLLRKLKEEGQVEYLKREAMDSLGSRRKTGWWE